MKILTPIKIDLIDPHPLPIMKVQQGNIGRGALVTLTANGAIAALTDETVRTYVKKPDGTKVYAAGRVTADGKAQIEFTNQMLAVPGRVELELELINDTDYITTPIAILEVGRSNIDGAAIESSNEFSAFVTALAQIGPAAAGKLGTVKPDGTTITADTDGTIHAADQDVSNKAVAFAAATSRTNLATGDTVATGFGKIAKWFADLGTAAFKGVSNVLSQTAEGYVLDARQGKTLADRIGDLAALTTTEKSSLVGALNEQNSKISGIKLETTTISKSVTVASNSYCTPYSHYGSFAISDSDIASYGEPISISAENDSSAPVPVSLKTDRRSYNVVSTTASNTVRITFIKLAKQS